MKGAGNRLRHTTGEAKFVVWLLSDTRQRQRFAVCPPTNTRQRYRTRQATVLSCASGWAHVKQHLCHVSFEGPTTKSSMCHARTTAPSHTDGFYLFTMCLDRDSRQTDNAHPHQVTPCVAHGWLCRVPAIWHTTTSRCFATHQGVAQGRSIT